MYRIDEKILTEDDEPGLQSVFSEPVSEVDFIGVIRIL